MLKRLIFIIFYAATLLYSNANVKSLKYYKFDPHSPIINRVKKIPTFVLDYLKDMDNNPDYTPYNPTTREMLIISNAVNTLPPLHKRIMKKRLVGIYFVNNFMGSGLTDWILDSQFNIHTFMVLNPMVLKMDISTLLTYKEMSCFVIDTNIDIKISFSSNIPGIFYILIHEGTHIVDYVKRITPYVEPMIAKLFNIKKSKNHFTDLVWNGYNTPLKKYNFYYRKHIHFYGLGGGPKLKISQAIYMYKWLKTTPFVSLYASQNWAEDLAELVSFYHLKRIGIDYSIRVYKGKCMLIFKPLENRLVINRFHLLDIFYK